MTDLQKNFIETVGSLARADSHALKILPSVTIAQAILESGWGKSTLTQKANALFGIKAGKDWNGRVYSCSTQECYDGVNFTKETACFRAYDSWAESIADHGAFLCGLTRYRSVVGETDYRSACIAMKAAGYATDPDYSDKLIRLIETYELTKYDGVKGVVHEVVSGDTLHKIAALYSTTVQAILDANKVVYPTMTADYIRTGWVLRIPQEQYTVQAVGTFSSLAEAETAADNARVHGFEDVIIKGS